MTDENQPEWAKRMERKLDAVLMALQQLNWIGEIDSNQINAIFGDRRVEKSHPMRWNSEQAAKVLEQGLRGEQPEFEK